MIPNIEEFKQTVEQIQGMGRALESLANDADRLHPNVFSVMAEGTVDEIARLAKELEGFICGLADTKDEKVHARAG